MSKLEVIDIDGELGIVFPDELLKRLDCVVGDSVCLTEVPEGWGLTKLFTPEIEQASQNKK